MDRSSFRHRFLSGALSRIVFLLAAVVLLIVGAAFALEFGDWRAAASQIVSAFAGRKIVFAGPLKLHVLTFTPGMDAHDIQISNPSWAQEKSLGTVGEFEGSVRLMPLLFGQVEVMGLRIAHPDLALFRDPDGKDNWTLSTTKDAKAAAKEQAKPARLPVIHGLTIEDGKVNFVDRGHYLEFSGTINSSDKAGPGGKRQFELDGEGQYARAPFRLKIVGNSLLEVQPDKAYNFNLNVNAENTVVEVNGTFSHPFDFSALTGTISAQGQDLANLYDLTGVVLPNTPPYKVSGHLARNGTLIRIDDFSGTVGSTDIAGNIRVETGSGRPDLNADLSSKVLNYKDLGAVLGTRVSSPGVAATSDTTPADKAKPRLLLPDAPLKVDRVRSMDADVKYHAGTVDVPGVTMRGVVLHARLDHGVLTLDPLQFVLPQGQIAGTVKIDARQDVPDSTIDMALSNARLEHLVHMSGDKPAIEGLVAGRLLLHGPGDSIHATASHADGQMAIVVPHGAMRQMFAELLGVDVARGLYLLASGSTDQTTLRCGLAHFKVQNGEVTADNVVFDTDVSKITLTGNLALQTEAMDFELKGEPKQLSVRVHAPVTIGGTMARPSFGIAAGPLATQAGIGVALGVLFPPAAVLAFIDPGMTDDADCKALITTAKTDGAPVSSKAMSGSSGAK